MAEVNMPEFPGNSYVDKDKRREVVRSEKKLEPVVAKRATLKKKPMSRKLRDTFVNEETSGILSYVVNTVLIPAFKDMVFEAVTGGLSMRLFGDTRGYGRSGSSNHTNYQKISTQNARRNVQRKPERVRPSIRSRAYNDDIILSSRGEASEVLDRMLTIIDQYGAASVADLYELCNLQSNYQDNEFGWSDLSQATIHRTPEGYLLDLPPAVPIDDIPF